MSTLQHINSVVNYNWPEMSRRYPGFDKPQIVPASTLRGIAPVYLRSAIDQSEDSYFMFIAGDPTKGDCSREMACQFFDELFYEKLQMPSSYEANEGYTREEAIDKEVLPPATDRQFRSFYDEQMAKVNAEQERQRQIDNLGFDPDDGNTIDVDVDGDSSDARAVGQAQSTAVGMPKKIFYCVDFHCPVGGMLGYNGGAGGRLGGRRRPGGYLRESDSPMSDILTAFKELPEELKKDVEQIATSPDGVMVIKHKDGKFTVVEDGKPVMKRVSADAVKKSGKLGQKQVTVMTKDELSKMLSECDDADPEQMMKEFVEKKRKCGVKEDEYRRPKNQPHNLHQVDEGEDRDKIKIIGEISKTELAGWTGSNFAVAFGGYSLQDFKRDIDSFPGAAVQTLTDKPVRYCQVDFGDPTGAGRAYLDVYRNFRFFVFESKNDVRWYQQFGDGNKAGFYRLSTGNVPSDMFEMLLEKSGLTFLPFFYGKCRIETRNGNIEQLKNLNEAPSSRDKLVKAIEQRLLKELIGRRLLNPIVKRSDEKQVLVPGFGRPITKKDCLALAQSFDDWKAVNHRNIDRDAPILNALRRLLDPSDEKLGINVDIPDDAVEYRPRGLYEEGEDVEEDEYRRPKNQPHNLHRVDEGDDGEVEGESEELNESMVRFCDRLIRG